MSPNIWATDLLGVRVIGLCHSVQHTADVLARELGVPLEEVTFDSAGVNHTAWFTAFRRGKPDLIPRIKGGMSARHVDETIPMLARADDPYQSNERVRAELMQLTGYFPPEPTPPATQSWPWFPPTPARTPHTPPRP